MTDQPNINDMTNEAVDAAIAERLGWKRCVLGWYGDWYNIWRDPEDKTHANVPDFTTDPTLTGFMLYGDSEQGVPGLVSSDFHINPCGPDEIAVSIMVRVGSCEHPKQFRNEVFNATYINAIGAIARGFLLLLWERSEG